MAANPALYSKYRAFIYSGLAVCFVAAAVAAFVSAAHSDGFNTGPLIGLGVIFLLISAIPARIARLRVVLREDRVDLVNPLRTYRIPWTDIERVDTFVFAGWKVRVWTKGRPRVAFGLSQYNKYRFGSDPAHDAFDRDAPAWIRRGYAELQESLQTRKRA